MLSELDKAVIMKLQDHIPLVPEPYKLMADELGITEKELLGKIHELRNRGVLRRVGAALYHRKAGYNANAMVVWNVPEDKAEEAGKTMASFEQVSHCYRRSTSGCWPYNMFTMVHAKTAGECEEIVARIADAVKVYEYELLYSEKEIKKSSMRYFLQD